MNREQKIVATGALSGAAAMLLSTWLLYTLLPAPLSVRSQSARAGTSAAERMTRHANTAGGC